MQRPPAEVADMADRVVAQLAGERYEADLVAVSRRDMQVLTDRISARAFGGKLATMADINAACIQIGCFTPEYGDMLAAISAAYETAHRLARGKRP